MSLVHITDPRPHNNNQANSTLPRWILYRSCAYLGGRGITFGDAIVPHLSKTAGNTSLNIDIMLSANCDIVDHEIDIFQPASLQHLFVGPRLEMMDNPASMLKALAGKLAFGGHLVIAQNLMNTGAKFYWNAEGVADLVREAGHWQAKDSYERNGMVLQIYKKLQGKRGIEPQKPRSAKPRACVCRYGALGDAIIMEPLVSKLAADGYEVHLNIAPYCMPVFDHNPAVSNILPQIREIIPNPELGQYWDEWKGSYERYINLSESLEGRYLKVEGRRDFYTPKHWRITTGNHNYYDATMRLGGYPETTGVRGELFFTNAEERNAQRFFAPYRDKFVIIWAMNGSSHHKVYPHMELVVEDWLLAHPNSIVITVGDHMAKLLEFEHQRLIPKCGVWSVRESLIAAKHCDLVIGPETMMTNAAGCMGTNTITLLSHSTHEALCKYFPADYCLAPENIACYPCFQLHYTRDSCPLHRLENTETKELIAEAPACALSGIAPERLLTRMQEVYTKHFQAAKTAII